MKPPEWVDRALCRRRDPNLYINVVRDGSRNRQDFAQEICYGCPVMAECATAALEAGDCGVYRGSVALSDVPTADQRGRLQFVAEHGRPADTEQELDGWLGITTVALADATRPDRTCETCSAPLQADGIDDPTTSPASLDNPAQCESCWMLAQFTKEDDGAA